MTKPVLAIIFNRPDKTEALMAVLAKAKPPHLYVAADGPRPNVPADADLCAKARQIATAVSWPCEVKTLFSDQNLGVDPAVEKALDWFFNDVESGIVLEDDCIPSLEFFPFAENLLQAYKDDDRVMMISGNNFQDGMRRGEGSYYFSRYANTWGWASWRRAWQKYDSRMSGYDQFVQSNAIYAILPEQEQRDYWLKYFDQLRSGAYTAWDAKWMFSIWNADGTCLTPNVNLVANVGTGSDATHTMKESKLTNMPTGSMKGVFSHPKTRDIEEKADGYLFKKAYQRSFFSKLFGR